MPLEKCHLCKYALELELVTERCAFHAAEWDPTIENQEHRAAHPHPPELRAKNEPLPAAPWEPSADARCPYCAPGLPCTTHISTPRPHPTKRPYARPTIAEGHSNEEIMKWASEQERLRATADDLAVLVEDAPKTPRDRG